MITLASVRELFPLTIRGLGIYLQDAAKHNMLFEDTPDKSLWSTLNIMANVLRIIVAHSMHLSYSDKGDNVMTVSTT